MTGVNGYADQHRVIALVGFLEAGGELEGVGGDHAVVVVGRSDHGGGVGRAVLQVVEGGVSFEDGEHLGVFAAAVLGDPSFADRKLVVAQHVHYPDGGEGHGEEVGALRHGRAHQ